MSVVKPQPLLTCAIARWTRATGVTQDSEATHSNHSAGNDGADGEVAEVGSRQIVFRIRIRAVVFSLFDVSLFYPPLFLGLRKRGGRASHRVRAFPTPIWPVCE